MLQITMVDLTFKKKLINSIFLQIQWKTILTYAAQPILLTDISTRKVSMQCVSTLLSIFLILQPKRTKIQMIQQYMNNEGKWKEAR